MKLRIAIICFVIGAGTAWAQTAKSPKTDAEVTQAIIAESVASYSGACACPYNRDRAGRSCGRRSAYSRPGGASPICYEGDVTAKMVSDYRASHGEKQGPVAQTSKSSKQK